MNLLRPSFLIAAPHVTPDMQSEMLEVLAPTMREIVVGTAILVTIALFAWQNTKQPFFLCWGLTAVCFALIRLSLGSSYVQTSDPPQIAKWSRRFTWSYWMAGALWGAGSVVLLLHQDTGLQLIVISAQAGIVSEISGRRYASPAASIGLVSFVLIPTIIAALLRHNIYFVLYACMSLSYLLVTVKNVAQSGERAIAMMHAKAENATLVARLGEVNEVLRESNAALGDLSMTDDLTGIANRRQFVRFLHQRLEESTATGNAVALLSIDVDYFKGYNDTYGHPAGDRCLQQIANAMLLVVRRGADLAARVGGEEFAILLSCSAAGEGNAIAHRLIKSVADLDLRHEASPYQRVTISIGVASAVAGRGRDGVWFTELADLALYQAKANGRNQSWVAMNSFETPDYDDRKVSEVGSGVGYAAAERG